MRRDARQRGFAAQQPWVPILIVASLALLAFVALRRRAQESTWRIAVMHTLAMVADSQTAHFRRTGFYATSVSATPAPGAIVVIPDSGAMVSIVSADSTGWLAQGTHPRLGRGVRTCYIYGGGVIGHDRRLARPGEPRCW